MIKLLLFVRFCRCLQSLYLSGEITAYGFKVYEIVKSDLLESVPNGSLGLPQLFSCLHNVNNNPEMSARELVRLLKPQSALAKLIQVSYMTVICIIDVS